MVPCPSALVVLLVAVAMGRILFGLAIILVFSLGLAAVLMAIGVLTVTASRLTEKWGEKGGVIQKLPVVSAGIVMVVGGLIAVKALLSAGILTWNL
jgi:ABC-type nickel/cobalt efflux system permease component RcnA